MMRGHQEPDPYGLLGVARDAPRREIRRAYRRLARQQHPDLNPRPDGPEQFAALTRAASHATALADQAISRRATLDLSLAEEALLARVPLRLSDRSGHMITLPAGTADGDQITVHYRGHVVLLTVHVATKT